MTTAPGDRSAATGRRRPPPRGQARNLAADGWQVTVRLAELGRDHGGTAQWPLTPDGNRYVLSVAGALLRPGEAVFGTTNAAVLDAVIPGYTRLTADERATARLRHAVGVHRQLGLELLADHADTLTRQEIELLTAAPDQLPTDQVIWDAPVPFVMVDQLVAPYTAIPAVYATTAGPRGPAGPVLMLRPAREATYLPSLDAAGYLTLVSSV